MGIPLTTYPQLRMVAQHRAADAVLTVDEAVSAYRRGWRHIEEATLTAPERILIDWLVRDRRGGVPFVLLDVAGRPVPGGEAPRAALRVRVADWPLLRTLWAEHVAGEPGDAELDGAAALAVYERNRARMVDPAHDSAERALIDALVTWHGTAAVEAADGSSADVP